METLQALWKQITIMGWSDILDIIVVAFLIYWLVPLFRSTGSSRIAKVVVALLLIIWLTGVLKMHTLNFILSQLSQVGLIAIVVLFQPELRRMIDHLSNMKWKRLFDPEEENDLMIPIIQQTVQACEVMSEEKVGALIVFGRTSHLDEYYKTGTLLDAQVSEQLIRNIFFPKASLHDGAMIIQNDRITAAGCVLPLSESERLHADLGTRHRAGVGMSEATDAVVVIVSEETGVISVAVGGILKRHLAPETLERLLRNELCHELAQQNENLVVKLRQKLHINDKGGKQK